MILGGGVDGLEYASAFGRLGIRTTLVEMAPRLLATADRDLVDRLVEVLQEDGIRLLTGTRATGVRQEPGQVVLQYERGDGTQGELRADRVLVAVVKKTGSGRACP